MTELLADLAVPTTDIVPSALVAGDASNRRRGNGAVAVTSAGALRERVSELYDQLAPSVLGYFRAHGAAEPEDLVAEVFVHVTRDLPRFRGPQSSARSWVFAIARHRLVDDGRRRAVRPRVSGDSVPDDAGAVSDSPSTLDPDLLYALQGLTSAQREVVVLRFVADLSLHDTARLVHRRVGAVKALQARGLAQLARALGDT